MRRKVVVLSDYRKPRWETAVESFLATKQLSHTTRRNYRLALDMVGERIGADIPIDQVHPEHLLQAFLDRWGEGTANTWNTRKIAVGSFLSFCRSRGWIDHDPMSLIDRRRPSRDRTSKVIPASTLETLWTRRDVHLREKVLWRLLYETAARANEALSLDIEELDFHLRPSNHYGERRPPRTDLLGFRRSQSAVTIPTRSYQGAGVSYPP